MNYRYSRDLAWQVLIKNNISALPVKVKKLCKSVGVKVRSYRRSFDLLKRLGLDGNTEGNDAFSADGCIFYDDTKSPARQRFSIAHELGHVLLHKDERVGEDQEREADIFASRLLAPLCVLHYLNVRSAAEISELCEISQAAAEIRYKRLFEIRERDREMREKTGRGCFLISPLEREVCQQFRSYIKKNRRGD